MTGYLRSGRSHIAAKLMAISDPKQGETAAQASIAIARGRSLQAAFDSILHALLSVMETPIIGLRSKALRGLSSIVTVDPEVLGLVSAFHGGLKLIGSPLSAKQSRTACQIIRQLFAMLPSNSSEST